MVDPSVEKVRLLRAMAAQWDRCAAGAPDPTYLHSSDRGGIYRRWALACRDKADQMAVRVDEEVTGG